MQLFDIISRVQAKTDDVDGSYVTPELVSGLAQDVSEWLYLKLLKAGHDFDRMAVELPSVNAGTPDLTQYQATGQPLAGLIYPSMVRWKLPGQDKSFYRRADGPLDFPRDIQQVALLDSWSWTRYTVRLSTFSTPLDLEITGDYLFDAINSPESSMEMSMLTNRTFASKLACEVGKARGNDKWTTQYGADADEGVDDIILTMTKENQGKTERLGRMSRSRSAGGPILNTR